MGLPAPALEGRVPCTPPAEHLGEPPSSAAKPGSHRGLPGGAAPGLRGGSGSLQKLRGLGRQAEGFQQPAHRGTSPPSRSVAAGGR